MPKTLVSILLEQNVPQAVVPWLKDHLDVDSIFHVNAVGLKGQPDDVVYKWAQENQSLIITYDEDFADARFYPFGRHYGIIRLRVWPTTIENTIASLKRLSASVPLVDWHGSLIIIDNQKIRVRRLKNK